MVLGASETFGLFESDGREYPARLQQVLRAAGSYEVLNAAVAGLPLPAIRQLWDNWASRFKPRIVVIYPTPHFYLEPEPPRAVRPNFAADSPRRDFRLRLSQALKDGLEFPAFLQKRRVASRLSQLQQEHPAQWFFNSLPRDRLQSYSDDLEGLALAVKRRGSLVILVTHAVGFSKSRRESERDLLVSWAVATGRATERVMLDFEAAAADATRGLGIRLGATVVDAAGRLGGEPRWFAAGDLRHFNDEGADALARLIAEAVLHSSLQRF